jgi:hypothetical protein
MFQESLSGYFRNGCPGVSGIPVRKLQECCPGVARIITPITRSQANRFFTFISDTYETSSIIFTTNKEIMDWAEMMGDPVLTTAMLDRILHHANCYSFRGESFRLKHPEIFN